jgi:2,3-bisphosphoglycerate-dependent phosphoglycerate mutase
LLSQRPEAPVARGAAAGDQAARLVLLRHGESEWNARNLFTGWADPDLTGAGEQDAVRAGQLLGRHGLLPDEVHTSLQRRAIRTANLALAACAREWIPVHRSWRLNGRHYGALQGKDKAQARAEFGDQWVQLWRRSYAVAPPPAAHDDTVALFADPRYAALPPEARPRAESLLDVTARLLPYWHDSIAPHLRPGATLLVVSHGNTLRALVKHLDTIGDEEIAGLDIPHGIPLLYEMGPGPRPLSGGRYLGRTNGGHRRPFAPGDPVSGPAG